MPAGNSLKEFFKAMVRPYILKKSFPVYITLLFICQCVNPTSFLLLTLSVREAGDGKSDILWRNQNTGENAVWMMDDTGTKPTGTFMPKLDTAWTPSRALVISTVMVSLTFCGAISLLSQE